MKLFAFALVLLFALPLHAEVTRLGELTLGQTLEKSKFRMAKLYGCGGGLSQQIEGGKIVAVDFTGGGCKQADVEMLIAKEYGYAKPIVSVDKSTSLWEGKTASILVTTGADGDVVVRMVPPGKGAKRGCFADDGFATFWNAWKVAVEKKDVAPVAMFSFPLKTREGHALIKDASELGWRSLISSDQRTGIARGTIKPSCTALEGAYTLKLDDRSLLARQVDGKWLWAGFDVKR